MTSSARLSLLSLSLIETDSGTTLFFLFGLLCGTHPAGCLWLSQISVWVLSHEHSYPSFIAQISKVLITANTKDCFLCVIFQLQTKNEPENWFLKRTNFRKISLRFIDEKNVIKFYFTHSCKINYTLQNSIKPNCNTTSFQCSFIQRYLEVLTLDE